MTNSRGGDISSNLYFCTVFAPLPPRARRLTLLGFVYFLVDDARQTEVADLDVVVFADEDVACRQIAVDVLFPFDVAHSVGDLRRRRRTHEIVQPEVRVNNARRSTPIIVIENTATSPPGTS